VVSGVGTVGCALRPTHPDQTVPSIPSDVSDHRHRLVDPDCCGGCWTYHPLTLISHERIADEPCPVCGGTQWREIKKGKLVLTCDYCGRTELNEEDDDEAGTDSGGVRVDVGGGDR